MNNLKILYWCPFISKVATVKAVINSAFGLVKYSNNEIKPKIINVFGEWSFYKNELSFKKILLTKQFINIGFLHSKRSGFIISRIKYFVIFLFSFYPLVRLLKNEKPDFIMIHLVTSLPLVIFFFFNFKTKLILRISGYPRLNFYRKLLWKLSSRKIYKVTCPTIETYNRLSSISALKNKIILLRDPIIYVDEINNKKKESLKIELPKNKFILSIGRLTKQKNFIFLINNFSKIKNKNLDLVIVGSGEQKQLLEKQVNKLKIQNKVHFIDYTDNVFNIIIRCKYFFMTSLWEDPGFVLLEAAMMNKIILSSNCPSGPKEILSEGNGGYLFKSNDSEDFLNNVQKLTESDEISIKKKIINSKKIAKEFTLFKHYKNLNSLLRT